MTRSSRDDSGTCGNTHTGLAASAPCSCQRTGLLFVLPALLTQSCSGSCRRDLPMKLVARPVLSALKGQLLVGPAEAAAQIQ